MSEEREHRRFSASQADRNFLCKGSSNLLARVPKAPPSRYAIEGTNAHAVLEAALRNGVRDARIAHLDYSYLCFETLDDGTNEFYLAVQMALNYIYDILDGHPDAQLHIEQEVNPVLRNAPGEGAGYCDVIIYSPSLRKLWVIDYKHGGGIVKEADCRQLKQYGGSVLFGDPAMIDPDDVDWITLVIVQPRAFHKHGPIREHDATIYELWEYIDDLDNLIAEAIQPDAPLSPGEEQCRFCDAVPYCPAREVMALQVVGQQFAQVAHLQHNPLPEVHLLDLNRLGLIRSHANTLRKWLADVEDRCYELARQGHAIPGAKLVEASPKRRYYGEELDVARKVAALIGDANMLEAVDYLNSLLAAYPSLHNIFRPGLIPLTTAEKLVVEAYKQRAGRGAKKKAAEDARQAFAVLTLKETSGSLSLVDDTDERPAVNKTQNAFAQITAVLPTS